MDAAFFATLGRAKQNQVRLTLARGCEVSAAERALLAMDPTDVTRAFARAALRRGCSIFTAMSAVYTRAGRAGAGEDAAGERLHVVFVGLRLDESGKRKQVPIDALRVAVNSVEQAEGRAFSHAAEASSKRRRGGALSDALATQASAVRVDGDAADARAQAFAASASASAKASAHPLGGAAEASKSGKKSKDPQGKKGSKAKKAKEGSKKSKRSKGMQTTEPHEAAKDVDLETTQAPVVAVPPPPTITAIIISPAALTSDAAKKVAAAREWLSALEYSQLAVPLDAHADVLPHVFLRGASAQAAMAALHVELQDMPILRREDAVAQYHGALPGDVVRVTKAHGVVHWLGVR